MYGNEQGRATQAWFRRCCQERDDVVLMRMPIDSRRRRGIGMVWVRTSTTAARHRTHASRG